MDSCALARRCRHQIVVITLWDGEGLEDTEAESEIARQRVAATTDLAVSSVCYEVLRLVPGPASAGGGHSRGLRGSSR